MSSKRLRLDALLLTLAALPVTVVESAEYEEQLREADRRIGARVAARAIGHDAADLEGNGRHPPVGTGPAWLDPERSSPEHPPGQAFRTPEAPGLCRDGTVTKGSVDWPAAAS